MMTDYLFDKSELTKDELLNILIRIGICGEAECWVNGWSTNSVFKEMYDAIPRFSWFIWFVGELEDLNVLGSSYLDPLRRWMINYPQISEQRYRQVYSPSIIRDYDLSCLHRRDRRLTSRDRWLMRRLRQDHAAETPYSIIPSWTYIEASLRRVQKEMEEEQTERGDYS